MRDTLRMLYVIWPVAFVNIFVFLSLIYAFKKSYFVTGKDSKKGPWHLWIIYCMPWAHKPRQNMLWLLNISYHLGARNAFENSFYFPPQNLYVTWNNVLKQSNTISIFLFGLSFHYRHVVFRTFALVSTDKSHHPLSTRFNSLTEMFEK